MVVVVVVEVNESQNISGSFSLGLSLSGKGWNGSFSLKGSEESNLLVGLFPGSKSLQLTQPANMANKHTRTWTQRALKNWGWGNGGKYLKYTFLVWS